MLLFSPFVNLLFRHCDKRQIIFLMILFAAFGLLPFVSFCGLGYNGLFWTPATYAVLCYMVGGCLTTYKSGNIEFNESQCNTSPCGIWVYRILFAFPFHSCSTTTSRNCSFFLMDPTFYFWHNSVNSPQPHRITFCFITGKQHQTSQQSVYCHRQFPCKYCFWNLSDSLKSINRTTYLDSCFKNIPFTPQRNDVDDLDFRHHSYCRFLILAFIAWIFDNIVVHPIQNTLIHVLEKLMINPKQIQISYANVESIDGINIGVIGRGLRTFSWRLSESIFVCSVPKNGSARWSCTSPRR